MRTAWEDWPYPALKVDKMGLANLISAIALSTFWLSPRATHRWSFHCCKVQGNIPDKVENSSMVNTGVFSMTCDIFLEAEAAVLSPVHLATTRMIRFDATWRPPSGPPLQERLHKPQ